MTALAQEKSRRSEAWKYKSFTLLSGTKAYKGARACLNGAGKVIPATASALQQSIGVFAETVDATAADKPVTVDLERELVVERFVNGLTTDAIASTDVGKMAYMLDDQTVTIVAANHSPAGRIWDVSTTKGVAIEKLDSAREALLTPAATVPAAYVANDLVITAFEQDAVYDVPTTGAAVTISLPAAAADGSRVTFCADGTKNGHTVTYRDVATALTTALTASKRHMCILTKEGGKWFANAYISP